MKSMIREQDPTLTRFHEVLVEEIRRRRPHYLWEPFTVAEIYQELVPYGSHRDRIGVAMNGDYEHTLLRLLVGEGGFLELESEPARRRLGEELNSNNPNTGVFREYAALDVRLNPETVPAEPSVSHEDDHEQAVHSGPEVVSRVEMPRRADTGEREARPAPGDASVARSCGWCQSALPSRPSLRFCPFCGRDVNLVPCASCEEPIEPDWWYCIACGTARA